MQEDAIESTRGDSATIPPVTPHEEKTSAEPTVSIEAKTVSHSMTLRRRIDTKQQEEREKRIPAAFRDASPKEQSKSDEEKIE